jgi:hypothetical protein
MGLAMVLQEGSTVKVINGSLAGRLGKIKLLQIEDSTCTVLVFVDLWDPESKRFDLHLLSPSQLEHYKPDEAAQARFFAVLELAA